MTTCLYLDLFSGASGDMLLGALGDLGLPLADLWAELGKMEVAGYENTAEQQVRHGLSGTQFRVSDVAKKHPARHLPEIRRLIHESTLSPAV